jgi:two-component system sensor histidine kinase KdpD
LHIALDTPDLVLLGRFDFVHSLRVLTNLIENAHKYSPPDTRVEVRARRRGDRLVFTVADQGPGVPPGEEDQIFEAFYRPSGVPPDTAGTGLGLSIAQRLAKAQQGGLSYEPRAGGGSNFLFWVPAAELTDL